MRYVTHVKKSHRKVVVSFEDFTLGMTPLPTETDRNGKLQIRMVAEVLDNYLNAKNSWLQRPDLNDRASSIRFRKSERRIEEQIKWCRGTGSHHACIPLWSIASRLKRALRITI